MICKIKVTRHIGESSSDTPLTFFVCFMTQLMRVYKWSKYAALLYTRSNCERLCQLVSADDLGLALLDSIPWCRGMRHNVSLWKLSKAFSKSIKLA